MLYEWPHPQIDQDWDNGEHQWREITPAAYQELNRIPLLYQSDDAFMQNEPDRYPRTGLGSMVRSGALWRAAESRHLGLAHLRSFVPELPEVLSQGTALISFHSRSDFFKVIFADRDQLSH